MSKYIYNVKKRLVWVYENREERDKNNETCLKEGGGIEMSTTSAFHIRDCTALLSLFVFYLPYY